MIPAPASASDLRVVLPFTIFLLHASLFGTWIVDDAGISFAYARNLASGDGLVCQPGNRVEGYSNFLWVATLVPFFLAKAFDPVWTPKALSVLCMLGTFLVVHRALSRTVPWGSTVAISGLTLASLQTGFVVWSVSGLENALYVLLLVSLMAGGLRCGRDHGPGTAAALGCAVAAAAMTRPEGVVYVATYPLWLLARRLLGRDTDASTDVRRVGAYALGFVIPLGCFLVFRWWYFADAMPNTYYAKGGPTPDDVIALLTLGGAMSAKLFHLVVSVGGSRGAVVLVPALVAASLVIALKRWGSWVHVVTGTLLAISTVAYLFLPADWMPEARFATPFYVFLYLYGAAVAWSLTSGFGRAAAGRQGVFALTIVLLALGTVWLVQERSRAFAARPTLPLRSVERSAQRFERYAAILAVESASLLAPERRHARIGTFRPA